MGNADQKAEELWDVYRNAVGGTAMKGEPLPSWSDLNDKAKGGWRAVATHVEEAK